MKKIPTLFKREFSKDHLVTKVLPEITPGCEAVLEGRCTPTEKLDGAACLVKAGVLYKRYDAKRDKNGVQKKPPEGAIPCQEEPDPITGHLPHWVRCEMDKAEDKYFIEAYGNTLMALRDFRKVDRLPNGTYEAIGPAWQGNPHKLTFNRLMRHGENDLNHYELLRALKGATPEEAIVLVKAYLKMHEMEGIVFWKDGEPLCKIKRTDFGIQWPPVKEGMRRKTNEDK